MSRRSSPAASLCCGLLVLSGLTHAGCASSDGDRGPSPPVRETQNPEAPPYSNPRPKIRPKDVVLPEPDEE